MTRPVFVLYLKCLIFDLKNAEDSASLEREGAYPSRVPPSTQ